jgi:hypothetical protein
MISRSILERYVPWRNISATRKRVALGLGGTVGLVWLVWFLLFPPASWFLPDDWETMNEDVRQGWMRHQFMHAGWNFPEGTRISYLRWLRKKRALRREFGHYLEDKAP